MPLGCHRPTNSLLLPPSAPDVLLKEETEQILSSLRSMCTAPCALMRRDSARTPVRRPPDAAPRPVSVPMPLLGTVNPHVTSKYA